MMHRLIGERYPKRDRAALRVSQRHDQCMGSISDGSKGRRYRVFWPPQIVSEADALLWREPV